MAECHQNQSNSLSDAQMRPQPNRADADLADAEDALSLISIKLIAISIAGQLRGEQASEV